MKCESPQLMKNGKIRTLWQKNRPKISVKNYEEYIFGCRKCYSCRKQKRKEWITRLKWENEFWPFSYFITLTYNDQNLPKHGVDKRHVQLFLKRLKKRIKFKYFLVSEYGGRTFRPHYHALIFTTSKIDMVLIDKHNGFYSKFITNLWRLGFTNIGTVTNESIAYVAGYTTKKLKYQNDYITQIEKLPTFLFCSKRPPLGEEYFIRNLDYFKNNVNEIPACFIKEKYFNDMELETIKRKRYLFGLEQFNKKIDNVDVVVSRNKILDNNIKKILHNKRNKV